MLTVDNILFEEIYKFKDYHKYYFSKWRHRGIYNNTSTLVTVKISKVDGICMIANSVLHPDVF